MWKIKRSPRLLLVLVLVTSLFFGLLMNLFTSDATQTKASYTHDDSAGYFKVDFRGSSAGIIPNIAIDPAGVDSLGNPLTNDIKYNHTLGTAEIDSTSLGPYQFTTVDITPASFGNWKQISVLGSITALADVTVNVYDCLGMGSTQQLLSNIAIDNAGNIDLQAAGLNTINAGKPPSCIRVQVVLTQNGVTKPVISTLNVSWVALPVFLINHTADAQITVGTDSFQYIRYSVSYTDAQDVVIWSEIPNAVTNIGSITGYTSTYYPNATTNWQAAPNPKIKYVDVDQDGIYNSAVDSLVGSNGGKWNNTGASIVVKGKTIPNNTVYWDLGLLTAGTTDTLFYVLEVANGWQNGILYNSQAHIDDGGVALQVDSDADASLGGQQPTVSQLVSSPNTQVFKELVQGTFDILDTGQINNPLTDHILGGGDNVVTYEVKARNTYQQSGLETVFNPLLVDDISQIVDFLNNTTRCTPTLPLNSLITAKNGGIIDLVAKTITWNLSGTLLNPQRPFTEKRVTYTVNFQNCNVNQSISHYVNNIVTLTADNVAAITATEKLKIIYTAPRAFCMQKSDLIKMRLNVQTGRWGYDPLGNYQTVGDNCDLNQDSNWALQQIAQPYGDVFYYTLNFTSNGITDYGDVFMIDKIPNNTNVNNEKVVLEGVELPAGSKGTIYYYDPVAAGNANPVDVAPDFNVATYDILDPINSTTNVVLGDPTGQNGWSITPPANLSTVKWIMAYEPCIKSAAILAQTGTVCAGTRNDLRVKLKVRIATPTTMCTEYTITNTGNFYAFAESTGFVDILGKTYTNNLTARLSATGTPNPEEKHDKEYTHVKPATGDFSLESYITSSNSIVNPTNNAVYNIHVQNSGAGAVYDTRLVIDLPQLNVNGKTGYADFIQVTGGTVDLSQLQTNHRIFVTLGTMAIGTSQDIGLTLGVPKGVLSESSFTLNVSVEGRDEFSCNTLKTPLVDTAKVVTTPFLQVIKSRAESVILPGGKINSYQLDYYNTGEAPSTDSFIIDKVPNKMVVEVAYTDAYSTITSTQHTCYGCKVYFAPRGVGLPSGISSTDPFSLALINTYFSLGTEVDPADNVTPLIGSGVWISPFGDKTDYIAWKIDDPTLTPSMMIAGGSGKIGFTAQNDDDQNLANGINPSPGGTLIVNSVGIFSNELLQAVGNTVRTTILEIPGLSIQKTSDKAIIYSGESFKWSVDYYNDASTDNDMVQITDNLPYGIVVNKVYHVWNKSAYPGSPDLDGNGNDLADSATYDLLYDKSTAWQEGNTTVTNNTNGTTTVDINIVGLKGNFLNPLEGGRLVFEVQSLGTLNAGTLLLNEVDACYARGIIGPYCMFASNYVMVADADLWLRKQVSKQNPLAGEILSYTLILSNKGDHFAENIVLQDILPQGLCYVAGTTVISTQNWSLGEPVVTYQNTNCTDGTTTLTWNNLKNTNYAVGFLSANSENIIINYQVQVDVAIGEGITLTNGASVTTTIPEGNVINNVDSEIVKTPYPDPYVTKTGNGPIDPGADFIYSIQYGNNTGQAADNVFLVDTLPEFLTDTSTDISILSVDTPNAEQVWFYNAGISGTLDLNAVVLADIKPLNGWYQNLGGQIPTHLAVINTSSNGDNRLGGFEGPYSIKLRARAVDPSSSLMIAAGTRMLNNIRVYTSSTEDPLTDVNANTIPDSLENNTDSASVYTVALDLTIIKENNPSGGYPGIAPGGTIDYTVTFRNAGSVAACQVWVEDTFPAYIDPISINVNFNSLSLVDINTGLAILPWDLSSLEITQSLIPQNPIITYNANQTTTYRWDLGENTGTYTYGNVCLPPQSEGKIYISGQVRNDTPNNATLTNIVHIDQDSGAIEDVLINNDAQSWTKVYLTDLLVRKTGQVVAPGTNTNASLTNANPQNKIEYTVEYDNVGNIDAQNTILTETIPVNACYRPGTVEANQPLGTSLFYSNDNGVTWGYTPVADNTGLDCLVTNFQLRFNNSLPAPANFDGRKPFDSECLDTAGCWLLNDGSGTVGTDGSGNTNDATLMNGPIWVDGQTGKAINFDGINDYITVNDNTSLSFGNGIADQPFSVDAWVRVTSMMSLDIVNKGSSMANYEYSFTTNASGQLEFTLYDISANAFIGRRYSTALTAYQGQWVHLMGTYDGKGSSTGIKLYVNGVVVDNLNNNSNTYVAMENGIAPLYLGRGSTTYTKGQIDEIKIYTKNYTAKQVLEKYYKRLDNVLVSTTGTISLAPGGSEIVNNLPPINQIFVYDTVQDNQSANWRLDFTKSWQSEAKDDITDGICDWQLGGNDGDPRGGSDDRCGRSNFPERAIIFSTAKTLYIFDAQNNTFWMKFATPIAGNYLLAKAIGEEINSVYALNGKIYIGQNNGRLSVIDFINDTLEKYDQMGKHTTTNTLAQRHTATTWNMVNATLATTGWDATNTTRPIQGLDVKVIAGKTYVSMAQNRGTASFQQQGFNKLNVTDQTMSRLFDSSFTFQAESTAMAKDGTLYWAGGNDSFAGALNWMRASNPLWNTGTSTLASSLSFYGFQNGQGIAKNPAPLRGGQFTAETITAISGTSPLDNTSNTILIGGEKGLSIIQEKQGDPSNGSVTHITKDYQTEEMFGDIRGMWTYDQASIGNGDSTITEGEIVRDRSGQGGDLVMESVFNFGNTQLIPGPRGKAFPQVSVAHTKQKIYSTEQGVIGGLLANGTALLTDTLQDFDIWDHEGGNGIATYMVRVIDNSGNVIWGYLYDEGADDGIADRSVHIETKRDGTGVQNWLGEKATFSFADLPVTYRITRTNFQITGSLSMGMWYKPNIASLQNFNFSLMGKTRDYRSKASFDIYTNGKGKLTTYIIKPGGNMCSWLTTANKVFLADRWYHIVAVADLIAKKQYLYVDGQVVAQKNNGCTAINDTEGLFYGAGWGQSNPSTRAAFDESFITATALSASDVQRIYQRGFAQLNNGGNDTTLQGTTAQVKKISCNSNGQNCAVSTGDWLGMYKLDKGLFTTLSSGQNISAVSNFDRNRVLYSAGYVLYQYLDNFGNQNNYASAGTYTERVQSSVSMTSWDRLFIDDNVPQGTSMTYSLLKADCVTPIAGFSNFTVTAGYVDISGINFANKTLCLQANLRSTNAGITPLLNGWRASYITSTMPSFKFTVSVKDQVNLVGSMVQNLVDIGTSTLESNYTNNNYTYQHDLLQTDLVITKTVNKSAILDTDINAGQSLTYTLNYQNNGPRTAQAMSVLDNLPSPNKINTVIASQISGTTPLVCTFIDTDTDTFKDAVYCDEDGLQSTQSTVVLPVNESGTIQITVTYAPVVGQEFLLNDIIINSANITTTTWETNYQNNNDLATTIVGSYTNVLVKKTGPTTAKSNQQITYTLDFANNGNVTADNFTLIDTLDFNTAFVSFNALTTVPNTLPINCVHSGVAWGGTVTCTVDNGGVSSLLVGESGQVEIVVNVSADPNLVLNNAVLTNNVQVTTSSTGQTNLLDDQDNQQTLVVAGDPSSILGRVFLDPDQNVDIKSQGTWLPNVPLVLTGIDIYGRTWGPNPVTLLADYPQYPTLWNDLMIELGLVPASVDPQNTSQYVVINSVQTDIQGEYSFIGLSPALTTGYTITQLQPIEYRSTGSDAGFVGLDANGQGNPATLRGIGDQQGGLNANKISNVILQSGETAVQNDFGENGGNIGNQLFWDYSNNGIYEPLAGEVPISGVDLTLYKDKNKNGVVDTTDVVVQNIMTNTNGQYQFTSLLLNDGGGNYNYIIAVKDSNNVLKGAPNTTGAVGIDNNSQKAGGYSIVLSTGSFANITADFGFFAPTPPPPAVGQIGDLVFQDINNDGIFNLADGDFALANKEVTLYQDNNADQLLDTGDTILSTILTDTTGRYYFNNLSVDQGSGFASYLVVVTDTSLLVSDNVLGTIGLDNNSQNATGYAIQLTAINFRNLTADFGYYTVLPPTPTLVATPTLIPVSNPIKINSNPIKKINSQSGSMAAWQYCTLISPVNITIGKTDTNFTWKDVLPEQDFVLVYDLLLDGKVVQVDIPWGQSNATISGNQLTLGQHLWNINVYNYKRNIDGTGKDLGSRLASGTCTPATFTVSSLSDPAPPPPPAAPASQPTSLPENNSLNNSEFATTTIFAKLLIWLRQILPYISVGLGISLLIWWILLLLKKGKKKKKKDGL